MRMCSCHITFLRVALLAASLICLAAVATSCRTVKETEYKTVTEYVHDTTFVFVHDTLLKTQIRHDSIDRYVEHIVYVDTNNVVHEKEVERLTKIIHESDEGYHIREAEYKKTIQELKEQLKDNVQTVEVRKPLTWFQKMLVCLGVCFIIVIVGYCVYLYFKLKTGFKKYG